MPNRYLKNNEDAMELCTELRKQGYTPQKYVVVRWMKDEKIINAGKSFIK